MEKALLSLGETPVITRVRKTILKADKVILPGVGSFGDAMGMEQYDLVDVICRDSGPRELHFWVMPGSCSFLLPSERPGLPGLGILPGKKPKIPEHPWLKIPLWAGNSLKIRPEAKLSAIETDPMFVFIPSFGLKAEDESIVAASTEYGTVIHASVERENVFACQFHPEKSGEVGLAILKNFIGL